MITQLRAKYFKSWQDTGDIRIAPLTGFFGTNSSGKTSILQLLLMLKQTVEAVDRQRVLETRGAYVELGTFSDILHNHQIPGKLYISVEWKLPNLLEIPDLEREPDRTLFSIAPNLDGLDLSDRQFVAVAIAPSIATPAL